jgi:diguanylate cyclase (GGDEF)-like protein/PAS domain S-box-containing protein/putative nucleotidyltransferase with HDIG domain
VLEAFSKATGFVTAILDLEGNILAKSGWRQICTDFHRMNPATSANCTASDTELASNARLGNKYYFYKCKNGLIDVVIPIIVREEHIANLYSGQFFFDEPNVSDFVRQAQTYGFDEDAYLEALKEVPVLSKEEVESEMNLLLGITQLIIEMAADALDQHDLYETLRKKEESLSESQVLLKKHTDDLLRSQRIAHLGTWSLDLRTNQVVWSEELYKMYGFDPEYPPPPYTEHMKLFTQESWERLSKALEYTRTFGIPYELELQTVTKDGSHGWMWVRGEAKTDAAGNIVTLWGAAQDITERKRIEIELEQSEERFKLLFDKAPLGYQSLDADGCFIEVNQQWLDTFGYSREEVIGKWFGDFLCTEYVAAFQHCFPDFKSQGHIHSELEMLCKNGMRLFILFEGKIAYDSNGEFLQTHCILQNVTEQKAAEAALRESEERYKWLFEYSGVGIGYYTTDGIVISYNQKALENIGGKIEDYVGKSIQALFPEKEAGIYFSRIRLAVSVDEPQEYEDYVVLSTGAKWFSSIFTRVTDSAGQVVGVQIASLDITARKKAEIASSESSTKFQSLFGEMSSGCAIYEVLNNGEHGSDYIIKDFNKAALKAEGKTKEEVLGKSLYDLRPNIDEFGLIPVFQSVWLTGEPAYYPTHFYVDERFSNWYENRVYKLPTGEIVALFDDVTERKRAEEGVQYLADHDHLTEAYNRRYFEHEYNGKNTEVYYPLAVLTGDLNGLKLINDSFGHLSGDHAIQQFAVEIRKHIPNDAILARIGGDEFAVILFRSSEAGAKKLARELQSTIRLSITDQNGDDADAELTATFGYSIQSYPGHGLDELLKEAETFMYRRKSLENTSKRSHVIDAIMSTLFEKSEREQKHSLRVSTIASAIATAMGLDDAVIAKVRVAGALHDIGKIGIDESILNKKEYLNDQEWQEIKQHPIRSARILASVDEYLDIVPIVKSHHERIDGCGYPAGLSEKQIPIEAKIIAVADSFDAMTEKRPYRESISRELAAQELKSCANSQFDPGIVDVFITKVLPSLEQGDITA